MTYPPVDIVDEHDKIIGSAMMAEVWAEGHRHRGVCIVIQNDREDILLQKRAPSMLLYPGCWDISAAGHVDTGMTYEEAAQTELREELAMLNAELKFVKKYYVETFSNNRQNKRFISLYRMRSNETTRSLGRDEVSEVRWFSPAEIEELLEKYSDQTADSLRHVYPQLINLK